MLGFWFIGSGGEEIILVLANTMHFKSAWTHIFNKIPGYMKFHINSEKSVNVIMMNLQENLKYYRDDNLKYAVLQLPYEVICIVFLIYF